MFYIEVPANFTYGKVNYMILNLNNIIFGQAEVPLLWYVNFKNCLESIGFNNSGAGPFLFGLKILICVEMWIFICSMIYTRQRLQRFSIHFNMMDLNIFGNFERGEVF